MEWELYIEGPDVPPHLRERAVAAAKQTCPSADGDLWYAACAARDRNELDMCRDEWTAVDDQLVDLWTQAFAAAEAELGDGRSYLAMRRALDHAAATARANWITAAWGEFMREGLDRSQAYTEAMAEWQIITRGEEDIEAGLAVGPKDLARRAARRLKEGNGPRSGH